MYSYAILDPLSGPEAEANRVLERGAVLGIEVTVPALAGHCRLGNIDPQHTGGNENRTAIEEAVDWPLPPAGTVLATVRPDRDALGAMAVLELRAAGSNLGADVLERIGRIAKADRFDHGPWPGPRPLDGSDILAAEPAAEAFAALAALVMDPSVSIGRRVALTCDWLRTGAVPEAYLDRVRTDRGHLSAAIAAGDLVVSAPADGRIAVVEGSHRAAVFLGYRLAPVVAARDPAFRFAGGAPHLKYTVAEYRAGYVHMPALTAELSREEPGWGGSPTIIGSPQGVSSRLAFNVVLAAARRHLVKP
jgi:hypothetical protein